MKKSLKHAIVIFFCSALVLFIIFSPILLRKTKIKSPTQNKKDFSNNSSGVAVQTENNPENSSENKKESINSEEIIKEEIVETLSVQSEQSFSSPVSNPVLAPIANTTPTFTFTPIPTPQELVNVVIHGQGRQNYKVNLKKNDTAFSVLLRASEENSFTLEYQNYEGLGTFVNCIAGICGGQDNKYWMFYYNGQFSPVGASSQEVFATDTTIWKFE